MKTIECFNNSSTPYGNRNKNSQKVFNNIVELRKVQKRLIMPTIGNISVGKSFFLNSMFGIDFCQVKSEITTKFILFIRHIDNLKEQRLYFTCKDDMKSSQEKFSGTALWFVKFQNFIYWQTC